MYTLGLIMLYSVCRQTVPKTFFGQLPNLFSHYYGSHFLEFCMELHYTNLCVQIIHE